MLVVNRAFEGIWSIETHNLDISESDLIELLNIATKDELFQLNGKPYEQTDGVAIGSPLGPLMANAFMYMSNWK